jgi:hypothetical protein
MKASQFSAILGLLLLIGCTKDTEDEPKADLKVSLSSDTMWVWKGGGKEFMIDITSGSNEAVTMSFDDPMSGPPKQVTLKVGDNSFRFDVKDFYFSKTEIKRVELLFEQSGNTPVSKSVYFGIGGTKTPISLLSTAGTVSRMSMYSFDVRTHPGAIVTMQNGMNGSMTSSFPAMSDGIVRFTDVIDHNAPLGQHTFTFTATRENFSNSDTLSSVMTVTE